jgi:D-3-phosphoglycerate dehydrogenase / 2-oxoglutarate reductase
VSPGNGPRITVADPLAQGGIDVLRAHADVVVTNSATELAEHLPVSDALIVRSRTVVTAELLSLGRCLRIVGRAGIGVDNIDVEAATKQGILVVNAPLGNVRSTAEHTMALLFALARRVTAADRAVRDGSWKAGYEGMQLAGKRLGLLGAGKVGRQVAAMAGAIGMDVIVCDPYLPDSAWEALGLERASFDDVLTTSDVVTIHVPKGPETHDLLGRREIAQMKHGAYVINCARGGLVDEVALADALESGQLAGAAVDVFAQEPPASESPLLRAPNTILTPHVAASTREAQAQVSEDIAAQIISFFEGRAVDYPINPSVLRKV